MYLLTVTAGPNRINVQDPYPTEDKVVIAAGPGETVITRLQDSQYDRLRDQLADMASLGLLTYTAIDGPASEIENDSSVPGVTVKDALDNLAGGVTANTELMFSGGRAGGNVSNVYLRGPGGTPTNLSGFVIPFNFKIVALSLATAGPETWTLEIRKNNSATVITSLSASAVERAYSTVDVDGNAGDELQFYCNGVGIGAPSGSVVIRRR